MKLTKYTFALFISLTIILLVVSTQSSRKCESIYQNNRQAILGVTERIDIISKQNAEYRKQIDNLTQQITQLQKQMQGKLDRPTNRGGERLISLGEYTITGFCGCEVCCGAYALNRPGGIVKGAAGVELIDGISVAAPLPLGTRIVIDGHTYIVQDRTAKRIADKYGGKIIDIYKTDHAAAWEVGNGKAEVYMLEA